MEIVPKVVERSEAARQEWFRKVEKIKQRYGRSKKVMQETADSASGEYMKVFGRIGMHPLMHLKGGKKRPRFVFERDEVWAVYKPPLWQMGGKDDTWRQNVNTLVHASASLTSAEESMLHSTKCENLQEWFGLMQGQLWIDRDPYKPQGWGFIQRLDADTDGPVVAAKTWRAQRCLQVQQKEHLFSKGYMCLVHGKLENKIQYVKAKFAPMGSSDANEIMLEHTANHDPFFDWTQSGRWPDRVVKWAETFVKPLAYYKREVDNSEYTLAYVNILTGITHQIRITMQSLGHPLVSDDRYLPKEQALADLKWCPRNFLTEVRSDWWDMCGPYKDEKRRRYTRISIENPLPALFQGILEQKLTLTEKLDSTADLYVGCRYWALGDEQLMASYPKDSDYRQKVVRWCQRKGIHQDALERLLLLPKGEIDELLNNYLAPGEGDKDEVGWVCSVCMNLNMPDPRNPGKKWIRDAEKQGEWKEASLDHCPGMLGNSCPGMRRVDVEQNKPAKGWLNYTADPTIHFLFQVNKRWLEARKRILKTPRPLWEVPPDEGDDTPCAGELLTNLEEALTLNAKGGGHGIHESELAEKVPGCIGIRLPLGEPPEDSKVRRTRLPGTGTGAQWTYCLKGKELGEIFHKGELSIKTRKLMEPVPVKEDTLPETRLITRGEKEKGEKAAAAAAAAKERKEKEQEEAAAKQKAFQGSVGAAKAAQSSVGSGALSSTAPPSPDSGGPVAKRRRTGGTWERLESKSTPGSFYYHNAALGETRVEKPPGFDEAQGGEAAQWSRLESKSNPGQFYYFNAATGENSVDRPLGVTKFKEDQEPGIAWERRESSSRPGNFYYFNPATGDNEINPPRVDPPWKLLESSTKKGQFYYFNEVTRVSSEHPPRSARAAKMAPQPAASEARPGALKAASGKDARLPPGWERTESDKYPGKFYYVNSVTNENSWQRPVWERKESASNPGKVYYVHVVTGETSWEKPKVA